MLQGTQKSTITPFWNRIPKLFLYPLQPSGLLVMAALLALFTLLPGSLIGWLLRLVLLVFFTKYCYEVLDQTSHGYLRPPAVNGDLLTQRYELPFKQVGVYFVLGSVSYGLSRLLGEWAGGVFGLVINLVLPASIMVLATSSSLRSALNPAAVGGMIKGIGWPYLALFGFLFLLSGGSWALVGFLHGRVPPQALLLMAGLSFMYFTVVMFHLMGYVVYQYHRELGLSAADGDETDVEDPELERFRQFMQEQKHPAALAELREVLSRRWEDLELHRTTHKLAKLIQQHDVLIGHGLDFIELLMAGQRVREAMQVHQDLVAAQPDLKLERAEHHLSIAQMLRDSRLPKPAIALINGFHTRFPGHEQIPALYLLAAKIFHEDLGDDAKAVQILRFVVRRHPEHELVGAVEHYLRVLEGTQVGARGRPS